MIKSDSLPRYLYRAFKCETFASDFVERGKFRMGRSRIYQEIEDIKRQDPNEGIGHYVDKDGIHEHFQLGNTMYLLCCSRPEVDYGYLTEKMGRHVVRIIDPQRLVDDVNQFLASSQYKFPAGILCKAVQYSKGKKLSESLDKYCRAIFSTYQKTHSFKAEAEFRLIAILIDSCGSKEPGDYLEINLGKKLDYIETL